MLRKSWKHLSVFLGILFFVTIGSGIWYLASNNSRRNTEPVKIYRTVEPVKKRVSDTTSSPVLTETDTELDSIQPETSETEDPRKDTTSESTPSDATDAGISSDGFVKTSDSDNQQSNDELATEKVLQQIEELEARIRKDEALLRELENEQANSSDSRATLKAELEAKRRALAKELNALSAEEQRAYLENRAANVKRIISKYHEKLRANPGRNSEEIGRLIASMQQILPESSHEEYMKQDIEELREYGFEPKF